MKTCTHCKNSTNFYSNTSTWCKDCEKERKKQDYKKNPLLYLRRGKKWIQEHPQQAKDRAKKYWEKQKERANLLSKIRRATLRNNILTYYSKGTPKCACCAENHAEFLTIDHIHGEGNKHRIQMGGSTKCGGNRILQWIKKNNYPQGFRILCHNCNMSLGNRGYCPHDK